MVSLWCGFPIIAKLFVEIVFHAVAMALKGSQNRLVAHHHHHDRSVDSAQTVRRHILAVADGQKRKTQNFCLFTGFLLFCQIRGLNGGQSGSHTETDGCWVGSPWGFHSIYALIMQHKFWIKTNTFIMVIIFTYLEHIERSRFMLMELRLILSLLLVSKQCAAT